MLALASREWHSMPAGKRMSSLIGKAQDYDNTFLGHKTWGATDDSRNESFSESNLDLEEHVNYFDLDFG
jgi:hypothetical protein